MHVEFDKAKDQLVKSLKNGDASTFSHTRHKLSSTLNTLDCHQLITLLADLKEALDAGKSIDADKASEKINVHFSFLLERMKKKIVEIEDLKVM